MNRPQHPSPFITRRSLLAGGAAGTALALLGCGGGGDGLAGVGTGGTGSFASGPIRGLGSIVVGAVHYDEATAQVVGDGGGAFDRSALRLGMVVEVEASDVETGRDGKRRATATAVGVRSEIEGPITGVDAAAQTFTVLGQVVQVTPATAFDDDLRGGFASLVPDRMVEVYGLLQADGTYTATRIDDEDDRSRYKLRGRIGSLDTVAKTFSIGTTVVSYAGASGDVSQLATGSYVRVELQTTPQGGTWLAIGVRVSGAGVGLPPAGARTEIEGYITAFSSARQFSVSGVAVDASAARWLPDGLALGVRVEVEGVYANGVLMATEVELEDDDDFEIEGTVESVDTSARTLIVRGIVVHYASARFKQGTEADLRAGVRIEVDGRLDADGTTLVATEIEFDDDRDGAGIEGRITSLDRGAQTFVVAGVTVDYSGARFEDGSAADLAVGVKVEVEGQFSSDGRTLRATEIEFDD